MVQRLGLLYRANSSIKKKNLWLVETLTESIAQGGVVLDAEMSEDLAQIMIKEEHQVMKRFAPDSFH